MYLQLLLPQTLHIKTKKTEHYVQNVLPRTKLISKQINKI